MGKKEVFVFFLLIYSVNTNHKGEFDVLKISEVPFPQSKDIGAVIRAPFHANISEFSLCYRILIEFYNDGLLEILKAEGYRNASIGWEGVFWQRTELNTGFELYGFQFFWLFFYRRMC